MSSKRSLANGCLDRIPKPSASAFAAPAERRANASRPRRAHGAAGTTRQRTTLRANSDFGQNTAAPGGTHRTEPRDPGVRLSSLALTRPPSDTAFQAPNLLDDRERERAIHLQAVDHTRHLPVRPHLRRKGRATKRCSGPNNAVANDAVANDAVAERRRRTTQWRNDAGERRSGERRSGETTQ